VAAETKRTLTPEEIFEYFADRLWRPSLLLWVGWPAAVVCFLGALVITYKFQTYLFGGFLFFVSFALSTYLVYSLVVRKQRVEEYIAVACDQIGRGFRDTESTLCLVQRVGLGLRDRILLVKRADLHFKGYFMSPWKARRLAGAFGIAYVESAKIIRGVLPLSRIKQFRFRRAFRLRYLFLALAGLGGGTAYIPRVFSGGKAPPSDLVAMVTLFVLGAIGAVLLFAHRQPEAIIHTDEYDLHIVADRPDPQTVLRFLRRLGYRDVRTSTDALSVKK